MRKMKKIFAMLLALTMIMGMAITSNAAGIKDTVNHIPSAEDTAVVSVAGLEADTTVNAYKIVEADYYSADAASAGFKGYNVVDAVAALIEAEYDEEYDLEAPVSEHVTLIANAIAEGNLTTLEKVELSTYDANTKTYSAELTAGAWVILVDNINTTMYNPLLAGVYYTNADRTENGIVGGSVNVSGSWNLEGTELYAKSTDVPPLTKEIVDPGSGNPKGDDTAVNAPISFKVKTTVPRYSNAYKELTFKLTDTLTGLNLDKTTVKVTLDSADENGTVVAAGNDTYALTTTTTKITIEFKEAWIRANGGKDVYLTYQACLTNGSQIDSRGANINTIRLDYTNNPNGDTTYIEDKTYHYNFSFDVRKSDEKDGADATYLSGAEFTLYKEDGVTEVAKKTTDAMGFAMFKGLDAGTYKLVETKAPEGYQIDNTVRTVVISAEYYTKENVPVGKFAGQMKSYSITVDGVAIEELDNERDSNPTPVPVVIKNTKLIALPSTGGIGTTIFTVAGCGIMIAAAFFFFAGRKKEN